MRIMASRRLRSIRLIRQEQMKMMRPSDADDLTRHNDQAARDSTLVSER